MLNLATEVASTDIPDWCYIEAGLPFPENVKTPEKIKALKEISKAEARIQAAKN